MSVAREGLVGVVLAAGAGTRLRPLTDELPKAMCPVGGRPLVDWAVDRVVPRVAEVAVNAHGSQRALIDHLTGRVHVSVEEGDRLGTAGAIGRLHDWIDGRHVLVHNADSFVEDDLTRLVEGWDGERPRLLVRDEGRPSDFGDLHFLGVSLLPGPVAARMPDARAGLYDLVWGPAYERGELETVEAVGTSIDCGTAADYLRANLHVSGGANVVAPGAVVEGSITRCVVWPGARVEAGETLVDAIRSPRSTVRVGTGRDPAGPG